MALIFLGNELMKVDQKGRVGIPARFMAVLRAMCPDRTESVGMMISPEKSIKILPLPHFLEEVERWNRLDDLVAAERTIKNLVTSTAELATLDKQNRIKLNPQLMALCQIRQQVVVAGSMHYMQLFDVETWKGMFEKGLGRLSEAMQKVADKEQPKPRPSVKQLIINMAEIEAREENPPERQ